MTETTCEVQHETATARLLQALSALAGFSESRGNEANAARTGELAGKLATQTFNLVVFGEFKRGKTTFINALIGDDLLPMAVVPLTSVVTLLHYRPEELIEVEFLDGHTETIDRETLADYVTERGNSENRKRVNLVRVAIPSELLRSGLQLVDTPGVGSVYEHNTEAARGFLPHVDGAVLMVASDPPISRGECEFLHEMWPHVARLFVVQNKVDQLRPEDLGESLKFTGRVLSNVLGEGNVSIFPLSAREALEARLTGDESRLASSGLPAFERELRLFQAEGQTDALLLSVLRNALNVAEDEKLGLDLERQALRMTVGEIEERYADFRRRREELMRQREDDTTLIRAAARKLIRQVLTRDYEDERSTRAPVLREMAETWAEAQGNVSPGELLKHGNQFIRETLFEVLGGWRQAEEARLGAELAASLSRFTDRANETLAAVYAAAREVFELPPATIQTIGHFAVPSRFLWRDWDWSPRPGVTGSILLHLLPGGRRRAIQIIADKLLSEHDAACGRLRYDFSQRAQAAFDEYLTSVTRSLSEASAGIDRAISRAIEQKRRTQEEAREAEDRISAEAAELATITAELRAAFPSEAGHGT
jgi:signal recognition particle receptor subunit beta